MNWIKKIDWSVDWEKLIMVGIIASFMVLSFLGGVEFMIRLQSDPTLAAIDMGALEIGLLFLMRGIVKRMKAGKAYKMYTATEIYIIIVLIIANSGGFILRMGADDLIGWIMAHEFWPLMARIALTLLYASPIPVILLMLIWIWQDGGDIIKKSKIPTLQDISLKDVLQKDVLDKWGKDNGKTARDPGDN